MNAERDGTLDGLDIRSIVLERPRDRVVDGVLELADITVSDVDLSDLDLDHIRFSRCTLKGVSLSSSRLCDVRFDGSTLIQVSFDRSRMTDCYFQRSVFVECDLRRVVASRTSFDRAELRACDLYRFQATDDVALGGAELVTPSLHRADLSGSDIRWTSIVGGLAHEKSSSLALLHDSAADLETDPAKRADAESRRLCDAVDTYRALSGLFSDRGQYADAGSAYLRAKQLERAHAWQQTKSGSAVERARAASIVFSSWIADVVCGYGERLWRVIVTMVTVALGQGVALALSGGVERRGEPAGVVDSLAVSFLGLVGQEPPDTEIITAWAQLIAAVGTGLGIALIGLFGFVLGNKIRFG